MLKILFYFIFIILPLIQVKYIHEIKKKDEAREPKVANKAYE